MTLYRLGPNSGAEWYIYDVGGSRSMVCSILVHVKLTWKLIILTASALGTIFWWRCDCNPCKLLWPVPINFIQFKLSSFSLPLLLIKFLRRILVSTDWYAHSFPLNSSYNLAHCVTQQEDSIALWKEVCSSPLLAGSTLILFLNKVRSIHVNALSMLTQI